MKHWVTCLEDGKRYLYVNCTPYEAMQRMLYTLNLSGEDPNARINKTVSGLHLYMEHHGKTYAVRN